MIAAHSAKLDIHVLSGVPAGSRFSFGPEPVSVGRAPEATLRFDAERDLAVSSRHAVLYTENGQWWVRDLGSRNGTYVNGRRIVEPASLSNGDRIAFGNGGPEVAVGLPVVTAAAAIDDSSSVHRTLWMITGLVAVLLGIIAFLLISNQNQRTAWDRDRAGMVSRLDSILVSGESTVRSLQGERENLAEALRNAQQDLRRAHAGLDRALAAGNDTQIDAMRNELQAKTVALERQQLAASLDFDTIERANRRAVTLLFVESESGAVSTGTAFAISPDAVLVTAKHVVAGADGSGRPRRMGVQFSDSDQIFPARLVAVSPDHDIAVIRVDNILGDVPTIRGFNQRTDTLGTGTPIAVIGFPLGGSAQSLNGAAKVARPVLSSGIVAEWSADRIEIQGYGAAGASGSPIFDADGRTVGLLFGGVQTADGRVVYGVPSRLILELLR
jgi:S1-C subfamily serine protease